MGQKDMTYQKCGGDSPLPGPYELAYFYPQIHGKVKIIDLDGSFAESLSLGLPEPTETELREIKLIIDQLATSDPV